MNFDRSKLPLPKEKNMKIMLTAGLNALALRFGGFGHGGGGVAFVLVMLVLAGVLIWAIARSGVESQKS
jgi:hypothetical protein